MKGLIYKELFLGRKSYLSFLGIVAGLMLLGILVGAATRWGNLQEVELKEINGYFQIFVYATFAAALCMFSEELFSVHRDRVCHWNVLEYTMPLPAWKQMAVRYLTSVMVLGSCFLLGLINAGIMMILFKQSLTGVMVKNLLIMLLVTFLLFCVGMPLFQRFSFRTIVNVLSILSVIACIVFIIWMVKDPEILEVLMDDRIIRSLAPFLYASPVVMPLLLTGSFALSVKFYQRREK